MPDASNGKKTCFVVMGFGEKTDFQANPQRVLDLNRTYEDIIEPAVTASGLECIRADKIIHSTIIDKPMYEQLLAADLVIADLSTSNANAIYELGVRHALRPYTTIVMAANGFKFPFDLGHLVILGYEHLGKEIGFHEVMRMRGELAKRIDALVDNSETDSPVYVFLPGLPAATRVGQLPRAATSAPKVGPSVADWMQALKDARAAAAKPADWLAVVAVLGQLRKLQPDDPYVIQQLALATYKSQYPDVIQSLRDAKSILQALSPDTSCDAETVGLWGGIHKRLWETGKAAEDLDRAVRAHARGYFIKNDYYNGINFAFLLNVRAANSTGDDAVADRCLARRIRREVLILCDEILAAQAAQQAQEAQIAQAARASANNAFWVTATKVEALLGLGRQVESDSLKGQMVNRTPPPAPWMVDSLNDQLAKLAVLNP